MKPVEICMLLLLDGCILLILFAYIDHSTLIANVICHLIVCHTSYKYNITYAISGHVY